MIVMKTNKQRKRLQMNALIQLIFGGIGLVLAIFLSSFVLAIPMMHLWNWLIVTYLAIAPVTYWQAWSLTAVLSFLIKGK